MSQQGRNRRSRTRSSEENKAGSPSRSITASRDAERQKAREAERIRRRNITIGLVVGAIALVIVVLLILINIPQEAPIPPETAARYDGLAVSRTEDGYPVLGESDARVKVSLYSSFDCPNCRTFHDETIDALVERVRNGQIALTFVPLYGYGTVPNGQGAAIAALCAIEQRQFWQFQGMLFAWKGVYGNQSFANNRISAGITALEMDAGQHRACVNGGSAGDVLNRARSAVQALLNFNGTPTVTINGVVPVETVDGLDVPIVGAENILAAIDREIERTSGGPEATPEATAEAVIPDATPEATPEATAEPAAEATPEVTPDMTPEATPEATEAA
jgi:protein-disulfide isomerase